MLVRALLALSVLAMAVLPARAGTLFTDETLQHDGLTRWFDYFVPDDLPASSVPLVLSLHGGTQNNKQMAIGASSRWLELAEEHKFIVILPNGVDAATGLSGASGSFHWNDCRMAGVAETGAEDVGFLAAVLDWAEANFQIDTERVYSTGSSNGGMMSFRLAFDLSDRIAAIGPNIAHLPDDSECGSGPANPISVINLVGTEDTLVPFAGGNVGGANRGTVLSSDATLAYWTGFLATATPPNVVPIPDINTTDESTVTMEAHCGGSEGTAIVRGVVDGGGHVIPSILFPIPPFIEDVLGQQNEDLETADAFWAFFQSQRLGGGDAACGNWCLDPGEECDDGNTSDDDRCSSTCLRTTGCPAVPWGGCTGGFAKSTIAINEKKPGKEKLKLTLKNGPGLDQSDFGDPVTGATTWDVCLFDDADSLVAGLEVDRAGDSCGSKPCWTSWKTTGFQYKDRDASSAGVSQMKLGGGLPGKTQIRVKATNGAGTLPVPIAAGLQSTTSVTVQLIGRDPVHTPRCFEATLDDIKKQDATRFKAIGN